MHQHRLADAVLLRLVEAYHRAPDGRFVLTRSPTGRTSHKISHPGGVVGVDAALIDELLRRRLLAIREHQPGYTVLSITLRGFDYAAQSRVRDEGSTR